MGNVQNQHRYTPNASETVKAVFAAGMDTDCGATQTTRFMSASVMGPLLDANPKVHRVPNRRVPPS